MQLQSASSDGENLEENASEVGAEEQRDRAKSTESDSDLPMVSIELQDQLMIMGFPEEWCALALR